MQADQKPVIWTVVVASIVLALILLGGFVSVGNKIENQLSVLNQKLEGLDIDEQAIANAIVAGIVMPTMPEIPEIPEFPDTGKLNELWEAEYSDEVEALEDDAELAFGLQFLDDNGRDSDNPVWFVKYDNFFEDDEVYDLITDGVDCDGDCVVEFIKEYDDMEIDVINLGLDDEDDRLVWLSTVIRVKVFTDEDDPDEYFFDKVHINSVVTSDDEVLEAEVTYSL